MPISEKQLISQCQAGDLKHFAELYRKYLDRIYRFIFYKVIHQETAEDLTSQTFCKAMDNISNYDESKGNFSTWLYQIARNTVIDYFRTHKNETNIDDVWGISSKENIENDVDTRQQLEKVLNYLQGIKEEQREIIIMRLWDQLSYSEIAQITGKSLGNCKMIFSRVMVKLREDFALIFIYLIILINGNI
jgi:RNA polymerase sigma-70 factor (ECF subfamily)